MYRKAFFQGATKEQAIQNVVLAKEPEPERGLLMDYAVVGDVVWIVRRHMGKVITQDHRRIECAKLYCERGVGYGYESWDERDEPEEYSCPLIFLALVEEVGSYPWRTSVMAWHRRQAEDRLRVGNLKSGDVVRMHKGIEPGLMEIKRTNPLTGKAGNRLYRILPYQIAGKAKVDLRTMQVPDGLNAGRQ